MVDNQHKKISGYRDFTQDELDVINSIKTCEQDVAELYKLIRNTMSEADSQWLSLAATHLETGFMYMVKSVARPENPYK